MDAFCTEKVLTNHLALTLPKIYQAITLPVTARTTACYSKDYCLLLQGLLPATAGTTLHPAHYCKEYQAVTLPITARTTSLPVAARSLNLVSKVTIIQAWTCPALLLPVQSVHHGYHLLD